MFLTLLRLVQRESPVFLQVVVNVKMKVWRDGCSTCRMSVMNKSLPWGYVTLGVSKSQWPPCCPHEQLLSRKAKPNLLLQSQKRSRFSSSFFFFWQASLSWVIKCGFSEIYMLIPVNVSNKQWMLVRLHVRAHEKKIPVQGKLKSTKGEEVSKLSLSMFSVFIAVHI